MKNRSQAEPHKIGCRWRMQGESEQLGYNDNLKAEGNET